MRILAFDASTEACSAALLEGGACIERYAELGSGHSERLIAMIDEVLAEGGTGLALLDGIAVGIGPGAFTGVRIGVAVAQGLAFGAKRRVLALSTLEALAFAAAGAEPVLACLDARMAEVYWACFRADAARGVCATSAPRVGAVDQVRPPPGVRHRGVGRGFAAYPQLAAIAGVGVEPADARALPRAAAFARLGAIRLAAGESLDAAELTPLYLRDKVALTEAERGV
ncbi:MAG TPA: tRNA (adenosine(37)-N6)-threonylcarbamoyltransferase complex dimerization subunit type 1 TsaB [Steroidobacteraceae bacterium]|nr:tRNA (adenosine(37)-N6)-threonylcarbamoyltransferase complex dimerization subunit type 1 TsaB [Steroidobacteraceae bacterium]